MKQDIDYIRRGVELADGFEFVPVRYPLPAYIDMRGSEERYEITYQPVLDALVAQLVRQVDALDTIILEIYENTTYIEVDCGYVFSAEGTCRTMSTLKAIVDSKVLEKGNE